MVEVIRTARGGAELARSVADIPAGAWDALAGEEELYLSTRWMRMLETTSGAPMRYVLVHDGGALVGGLPTVHVDESAPWLSGRPDTLLLRCVRERRAGAGETLAAIGGDPTSVLLPGTVCGGRHLGRNRVVAASRDAVERAVHAAEELARKREDRSVSFLYVDECDPVLLDVLEARGYLRYESARYHWLDVPGGGFPGYLQARSRSRRGNIRHERRVLREAGVQVEIEPLREELIPRLAELETNLLLRYGHRWSPQLSERILSGIAEVLGSSVLVSMARREGEVTGFLLLVERGATWYGPRAGADYDANGDLPVHFEVTYYRPLEVAAARGIATIHYGTGSDGTKASRGCGSTVQHTYTLPLAGGVPRARARRRRRRVEVEPLDPNDERGIEALYRLQRAVVRSDVPDYPPLCPLDVAGAVRFAWPGTTQEDLLARDGRRVVGAVRVVRRHGRPHEARLEHLFVEPSLRRTGIGSTLLRAVWERFPAVEALTAPLVCPLPDGPDRDLAAERFARSHGATEVERSLHLRLSPLPARSELEQRLERALERVSGYSLRHWGSAVPELLREGVVGLLVVAGSAPDLASGRTHLQGMERLRAGRQRHCWDSGVWHDATSELVAWSSLTMSHTVRDRATQGMTVVSPGHRGRGLGLLVKLANLLHALTHDPTLASIDAANAVTKTPMININTRVGYRRVDEWVTWRLEPARS